jgi:hypothetical protein
MSLLLFVDGTGEISVKRLVFQVTKWSKTRETGVPQRKHVDLSKSHWKYIPEK